MRMTRTYPLDDASGSDARFAIRRPEAVRTVRTVQPAQPAQAVQPAQTLQKCAKVAHSHRKSLQKTDKTSRKLRKIAHPGFTIPSKTLEIVQNRRSEKKFAPSHPAARIRLLEILRPLAGEIEQIRTRSHRIRPDRPRQIRTKSNKPERNDLNADRRNLKKAERTETRSPVTDWRSCHLRPREKIKLKVPARRTPPARSPACANLAPTLTPDRRRLYPPDGARRGPRL